MRQLILFLASIASVLGALFLVALTFGLIVKGNPAYGMICLFLGVPCLRGMAIVCDDVRSRMALTDDPDLDVDIIKPKFTKFGGGS